MSHIAWASRRRCGERLHWRGEVVELFASAPRRKHEVAWEMYAVRHRVVRIQEDVVMAPHAVDRGRMCPNTHTKETDRMVEGLLFPQVSRSRGSAEQWTMNRTWLRWKHSARKCRWSTDIGMILEDTAVSRCWYVEIIEGTRWPPIPSEMLKEFIGIHEKKEHNTSSISPTEAPSDTDVPRKDDKM